MATDLATVQTWSEPSGWSAQGREIRAISNQRAVAAHRSLAHAEQSELEAQFRKKYLENRLYDANELMNIAIQLSDGDALKFSGLSQLVNAWFMNEAGIFRDNFGS